MLFNIHSVPNIALGENEVTHAYCTVKQKRFCLTTFYRKCHVDSLFVCFKGRIEPLPDKSVFAEFPRVLMKHEAIEIVCAHITQSREPPPYHGDVLGVLALHRFHSARLEA